MPPVVCLERVARDKRTRRVATRIEQCQGTVGFWTLRSLGFMQIVVYAYWRDSGASNNIRFIIGLQVNTLLTLWVGACPASFLPLRHLQN